ncbi:MAG: hypothetical protein SGARI_002993 [Bacillariaceae sp.]
MAKFPDQVKAREAVLSDWKQLESGLLHELNRVALELDRELCPSLASIATVEPKTEAGLMHEILLLEREIQREAGAMNMMDAALAPASFTLCEATSCANDGELVLKWNHLANVETTVVFPLDISSELVIQPTVMSSSEGDSEIEKLYRFCLDHWRTVVAEETTEIDGSLLTLSRRLAKLDCIFMVMQRLPEAIDTVVSPLDDSKMLLTFRAKGNTVRVTLELSSLLIQGVSSQTAEGSLSLQVTKQYDGNAFHDSIDIILHRYLKVA